MPSRFNRKYAWTPDVPDFRDYTYYPKLVARGAPLPPRIDLAGVRPVPINDQGQLGSCVGNSVAEAHLFAGLKEDPAKAIVPSRLMIYYNARVLEGNPTQDSGCQIRDAIKALAAQGVCPESMWPYDVANFATPPPASDYAAALQHTAVLYRRLENTDIVDLKSCLAEGYPFVMGITVYESFESDAVAGTGVVPMPSIDEQCLGGHAVLFVGYDDATQRFKVQNSWGATWGQMGYFTLPYEYATHADLADDAWTISTVRE